MTGPTNTAETKPAVVLHFTSGGEPLLFALEQAEATALGGELEGLLRDGGIRTISTRENPSVTVNFAHVAVAYIDDLQRKGKVFGLR